MTPTFSKTILIVGGGLAGLTAAYRLHRAGFDFALVDARERLGGRILSVGADDEPSIDGFDLGPSWFWPDMHPEIARFAQELGLAFFPQHADGAMAFERSPGSAPEHYRTLRQEPQSMRLVGGSGAIISALADRLPKDRIRLGTRVTRIVRTDSGAGLQVHVLHGSAEVIEAAHVIFALPPRLLAQTIEFEPAPDEAFRKLWHATPTWMAPHAKFFALYEKPFWRAAGLSGAAQSMVGPLVEIHDATTASGKAALFGFLGVPANVRREAGRDAIIAASVNQLGRLFGPEALKPAATLYKDWAADPLTATTSDLAASGHPTGGKRKWVGPEWSNWMTLAGSETAVHDPGYLAGAVAAGEQAAKKLIESRKRPETSGT
ncbi:flavin monoamine oxidase family protein [Rhizobium paranaense]|uniref:Monoamine oxidase n=1 Tax=Rhizobium paranaense TaxID=1650438 RepID=A0A7W8XTT3_9HYPH|nr:FAD-dependent oxidoreductase [Rhizobium paranaense]MBB5575453.1 monoamine oxidase [Rhizobium paranaense]